MVPALLLRHAKSSTLSEGSDNWGGQCAYDLRLMLPNSGEKGKFYWVANCSRTVALGFTGMCQQGWRYRNLPDWKCTMTTFWGGNVMWNQAGLPWDASTPFLTLWFSVASCSQHGHGPHQPSPWEMSMWGSEAAAQHMARTPWACSSPPFQPCHLKKTVPWPHTSAKNLVKGLKLLQAREKIQSLKKEISQPHSPSRALFVPFLILAHPKHVFKLLLPQPQELETCFKKKKGKKKEKKPHKARIPT